MGRSLWELVSSVYQTYLLSTTAAAAAVERSEKAAERIQEKIMRVHWVH